MIKVKLQFNKHDAWVGLYWKRHSNHLAENDPWDIYVCIIPCFPIHVYKEAEFSNLEIDSSDMNYESG